ncbi:MAG: hypothetical protein JSW25_00570 [Thermoplasmata archaeon]|nr:MAG: hypothetical protein JSW25_00570 [Thermoplasmata archaeon]
MSNLVSIPSVIRYAIAAAALVAAVLLVVGGAAARDNTGPPVIFDISEGGYASDWYELSVWVSGDMMMGTCYYGIDTDDQGQMVEMEDNGAAYVVRIDLTGWEDGPYTLYVRAYNTTGETVESKVEIDVDNNSPFVEAITDHSPVYGTFVFSGRAVDAYLNESAVYMMIDDIEADALDRPMTKVGDHFEYELDATTLTDGEHFARIWAHDLWGNNNKSGAVVLSVSNKANLVILNVTWTKTKVEAGEDVVAVVTIKNQGGAAASDFKVGIMEGEKVVGSTKVTDPLGSGDVRDVTVKWSMDEEDSRELFITVDPDDDVDETYEQDNQWPDSQKVTFEGGTPGFGAVLMLAALAMALVPIAFQRRR